MRRRAKATKGQSFFEVAGRSLARLHVGQETYRRLKVLGRASIAYCRSYVLDQVSITVLCPIDCSGCAPTNGASSPPSTSSSIPAQLRGYTR